MYGLIIGVIIFHLHTLQKYPVNSFNYSSYNYFNTVVGLVFDRVFCYWIGYKATCKLTVFNILSSRAGWLSFCVICQYNNCQVTTSYQANNFPIVDAAIFERLSTYPIMQYKCSLPAIRQVASLVRGRFG